MDGVSSCRPLPATNKLDRDQLPSQSHDQQRQHQPTPGRIVVDWVRRLEKINANLDNQQEQQQIEADNLRKAEDRLIAEAENDLCFRASQLLTELLLMLFAACLLTIAMIVIVSKKVPTFMDSYEIVPEFLFFLCVFVASYSFVRWIIVKLAGRIVGSSALAEVSLKYGANAQGKRSRSLDAFTKSSNLAGQASEQRQLGNQSGLHEQAAEQRQPLLIRSQQTPSPPPPMTKPTRAYSHLNSTNGDQRNKFNVSIRSYPLPATPNTSASGNCNSIVNVQSVSISHNQDQHQQLREEDEEN